jgi:4'-phosphopantetheinyl transferase
VLDSVPMRTIKSDRFESSASSPSLSRGDVHLWLLALDGAPDHRAVAASAHALLGRLLARSAGLEHTPSIARTKHGKPYAPTLGGIDFNLSHARDHVLIALAREQPVGVDLERIDRRVEVDELARRFFAPAEADALSALPEAHRVPAFLRLWTCKEAVLKALGEGISFGLERVAFDLDAHGMPTRVSALALAAGRPDEWQVVLLDPAPDFVGALAWRGPPRRIRAFRADA